MDVRNRTTHSRRTPFVQGFRLAWATTIGLAIGTLIEVGSADADGRILSVTPSEFGFLTLASGHTFKYLGVGPIAGSDGTHLALAVNYATNSTNMNQLTSEADELFEYVRWVAEAKREEGVVIVAHFGFEFGKASTHTYNIVYTRRESGQWIRLSTPMRGTVLPPPRTGSPGGGVRDPEAELQARMGANAWLKLADAELHSETWETSSPLLKRMVSKDKWVALATAWTAAFGRVRSRELRSTLSTHHIYSAPEGSYVVFEYGSVFHGTTRLVERIVMTLCNDGLWRVAGYSRGE